MKKRHSESILQREKVCFLCGTTTGLQRHHCLGGPYRQTAEQEGLWVWLCAHHHTGADGVHQAKNKQELKNMQLFAQQEWLRRHNWDMAAWLKLFGKDFRR